MDIPVVFCLFHRSITFDFVSMCEHLPFVFALEFYMFYFGLLFTNERFFHFTFDILIIDIDECHSNPCQHGGSCHDRSNGYTCACRPGYSGTVCQTGKHILLMKDCLLLYLYS